MAQLTLGPVAKDIPAPSHIWLFRPWKRYGTERVGLNSITAQPFQEVAYEVYFENVLGCETALWNPGTALCGAVVDPATALSPLNHLWTTGASAGIGICGVEPLYSFDQRLATQRVRRAEKYLANTGDSGVSIPGT